MKVLNIHQRTIHASKAEVAGLMNTLATKNDMIWPREKWPAMKFKDGLKVGNKGGHGPIKYSILRHIPGEFIEFEFSKASGLNGKHWLQITELEADQIEIKHVIEIKPKWKAVLPWTLGIRWLHDALIEDAFDKVHNHFSAEPISREWSIWVKLLRKVLK